MHLSGSCYLIHCKLAHSYPAYIHSRIISSTDSRQMTKLQKSLYLCGWQWQLPKDLKGCQWEFWNNEIRQIFLQAGSEIVLLLTDQWVIHHQATLAGHALRILDQDLEDPIHCLRARQFLMMYLRTYLTMSCTQVVFDMPVNLASGLGQIHTLV